MDDINNAIDALHAAFVGTPAEDAGTPIDFAQDATDGGSCLRCGHNLSLVESIAGACPACTAGPDAETSEVVEVPGVPGSFAFCVRCGDVNRIGDLDGGRLCEDCIEDVQAEDGTLQDCSVCALYERGMTLVDGMCEGCAEDAPAAEAAVRKTVTEEAEEEEAKPRRMDPAVIAQAFANICVIDGDRAWARLDEFLANIQVFGLTLEQSKEVLDEAITQGFFKYQGVITSTNPKVWLDEAGAQLLGEMYEDWRPVLPDAPVPEEGSCPRCEDSHPLEDLGDGGLCSDCGVDVQEEEANRLQEMNAAQTVWPGNESIHDARFYNLLERIESLEEEVQTLRLAAVIAASDSTKVWEMLEQVHRTVGATLGNLTRLPQVPSSPLRAVPKSPQDDAPTPEEARPVTEDSVTEVSIKDVEAGVFLRRGKTCRMLVKYLASGRAKVLYRSPTKGWTSGYCDGEWAGSRYTPSADETREAHAVWANG